MSQGSRDSGHGMLSPFGAGAIGAGAGGTGETATTTRFWWVRHAPVAHEGRIYGQKDMPCDCTDTAVFTGLARQLPRDAVWVTSNLRRTHETARAIVHAVDTSANSLFHRLSMSASAFASSFDAGSPSACENAAIFLRVRLRSPRSTLPTYVRWT